MPKDYGSHAEFIQAFKEKKHKAFLEKKAQKIKWIKEHPAEHQELMKERKAKQVKRAEKKKKVISKFVDSDWQHFTKTSCKFRSFGYLKTFDTSPKEKEIEDILTGMDIKFYREVSFDGRKRFDFYLFDLDIVIEYDGKQHFESVEQIKNDKYKNKLLKKNGIKYFRYNFTHRNLKHSMHVDLNNKQPGRINTTKF